MSSRLISDPTTSIALLLAPITGRLIGPGDAISKVRSEIKDEPATSVDYQFWRAGTWFVALIAIIVASIALLVAGDAAGSDSLQAVSGWLIWAAGPALIMLGLFSARYGYVSRNRALSPGESPVLLRSTLADLVFAVLVVLIVVVLS